MTHQKYILDILENTKLLNCHTNDTPIEVNYNLTLKEDDPRIEKTSYQKLIGRLLYLSHTQPDISYSVHVLSQFMHSPRQSHFQAAHRVLSYLGDPFSDLASSTQIKESRELMTVDEVCA